MYNIMFLTYTKFEWEIFHETVATAFNVRIVGALGYSITPYSLVAKTKV